MRRPLLVFALLGTALFAADRLAWRAAATPLPVVVPAARVAALREELAGSLGRAPSPAEIERALAHEVDDELLLREALARGYERDDTVVFRRLVQNLRFAGAPESRGDASLFEEAIALGMHANDPVARRRLIQRMRLELESEAPSEDPDDAELRAHYERHAERYRSAPRARFAQLYFRGDREREARIALARIAASAPAEESVPAWGEPFLHPVEQPLQAQDEIAGRFGADFAGAVFAAPLGAWSGPVASSYGLHLVLVREREAPRALAFEEVRETIRHVVLAERRRMALERGIAALRDGVQVVIE
jgi:hypothetical protein